jgi:hypothetical protein
MSRCRRGSGFVRGGLADGVELDDETVWIRNFDMPPEVPFSRCSVLDPECVEVPAPVVEVVDAECDRAEAVERACKSRSVVQAEGESAAVDENDTHNTVFFFEGEARDEAEHGGIPVAAAHDVGYRQPKVMQPDNGRWSDARLLHGRARQTEGMPVMLRTRQGPMTGVRFDAP